MPGMATSSGRSATSPVWWKGIDKAAQAGATVGDEVRRPGPAMPGHDGLFRDEVGDGVCG
jgi:hypothetical protein